MALTFTTLTPEQLALRADKITASFAPALMAGDADRITREWMRLVDHPDYQPEDLSEIWAVQLGLHVEPLALDWHERKTGQALSRRGEFVPHPTFADVSCTLDAYRASDGCVIDVKAPGKWRKIEDVLAYYPAQLVVQRACVGARAASLLVVHGGAEPEEHPVEWDDAYEQSVWDRIGWFRECVETLTPPIPVEPVAPPVKAEKVADMWTSNAWAESAAEWLATQNAAKRFATAAKDIKGLVEADVKRAFGHGIEAARNKAGSISIRESKNGR